LAAIKIKNQTGNHNCVHCGVDCGKYPVISGGLKFCCHGCRTVYELLSENKLYTYYKLEQTPGIRVEEQDTGTRYDFLDKEEIAQKLILFAEGNILKVRFYIPVIHCASCIWLLEHLGKLHTGIKYSTVNFVRKEVEITFDKNEISLKKVLELLESIHYIPDLSQSIAENQNEDHSYKSLLYKLGVAGFVFINVMTYSLPAYFNGKPVEGTLGVMLAILSYILTIPVVFYSGNDYFKSALKNLKKGSVSIDLPIAIGIFVLFLVTSWEVISGRGPGYSDSLSGLIFFLLVGKWYQGKSYEALSFERNYKSWFPIAVTKINKQVEESILLEKIEPGDILLIRHRELIPADSLLIEGSGWIDYSFVTGESAPVLKKSGDFLYAGGRQMGGMIKIKVEKEVIQSHLTHLWNQDKSREKPSENLQNLTDKISRYFTIIVIVIALAGFSVWILRGNLHTAVFVFTSVLIIACPCALALSAPFTFGNTMRIFGRKGCYIKNSGIIERLSRINTVVFDKTGTLTHPNKVNVNYEGRNLSQDEKNALYSLTRQSPHPMSMALSSLLKNCEYTEPVQFTEVEGRGVFGQVHHIAIRYGSPEFIRHILNSDSADISGESENTMNPSPESVSVSEKTGSVVMLAINNEVAGTFRISNKYRENINEVIHSLSSRFDLYLLTGDNQSEKENLSCFFLSDHMSFNMKPQDKAEFVRNFQNKGASVMMTGDGLNDAGALMQSDVALTIADKAYQFSPASDAVLEAGKFGLLERFISFSHTARKIVILSLVISSIYNLIGIGIALTGKLSPVIAAILMPASSVSVVAFATFATRLAGKIKLKIGSSSDTEKTDKTE
jgi:P-type Cu+ transporter